MASVQSVEAERLKDGGGLGFGMGGAFGNDCGRSRFRVASVQSVEAERLKDGGGLGFGMGGAFGDDCGRSRFRRASSWRIALSAGFQSVKHIVEILKYLIIQILILGIRVSSFYPYLQLPFTTVMRKKTKFYTICGFDVFINIWCTRSWTSFTTICAL